MNYQRLISGIFISFIFIIYLLPGYAWAAIPSGDLAIIEFKMTGSESAVIENISSGPVNLQNYILEYFNKSSQINFNVPTSNQQLPNFILQSHQSFLLSGDSMATCGAAGEANLGMSLSDTNGYFEIVKVTQSAGVITYTPQDNVSWTSSSSGSGIDILSVPSASGTSGDPGAVWYRKLSDGSWNKYEIDAVPCNLFITTAAAPGTTYVQWANGEEAPAVIIAVSETSSSGLPPGDVGLAAPQITELLPNPAAPASDADDEFIEVYNPNDALFDLSGFTLEVGLTTNHDYKFPAGTVIGSKQFAAFYSSDTGLSLSNTNGQARLLDPNGQIINQTNEYNSAKEGQAWALAKGDWYWTSSPTPGAANVVGQGSSATTGKSNTGSKAQSSTHPAPASNSTNTATGDFSTAQPVQIHSWTLAGVGSLALLYGAYEYRNDLANHIDRFRRYREVRATAGANIKSTGGAGFASRFGRWQNDLRSRFGSGPRKQK